MECLVVGVWMRDVVVLLLVLLVLLMKLKLLLSFLACLWVPLMSAECSRFVRWTMRRSLVLRLLE